MQAAEQKAAAARRAVVELMAAEEEEQRKAQARARKRNQQGAKAKQQSAKLPAQAQLTQAYPPNAIEQAEAQRQQAEQVKAVQTSPCEGAQEADADSAKAEAKRAKKQRQKAKKQCAQQQAAPQQPAQQSSVPQQPLVAQQGDDQSLMPKKPEADANAACVPSSSESSPQSADPPRNKNSSPVLGKQPTGVPVAAAALTCTAHDRSQLPLAVPSTFSGVADLAAAASPPGLGFAVSVPTKQKRKGEGQSAVRSVLHPVTGSCQASPSPPVPAREPHEAGPAANVAMIGQQQRDVDKPAVQPNMRGATNSSGQHPALPSACSSIEMLDGILTPYTAPAEHVKLLFHCPLTKVSASNFWSLLASVQPDDMLLRCARLHM